ncbi:MAG: DUF5011 domain-containing protein, partial [Bacilli bacterium]|nr:DUF5011 domain-containing protein [Bacilli bacterium]
MNFKKFLAILFIVICGFYFAACDGKKTDNKPVISGAEDITIEKGSAFVPLAGVTAKDEEDGDLTDAITYSGNINVNQVGKYTATYT